MPIVNLPVPEVYESSTRPIAVQIAKYIMKDFPAPKNARIVYPGPSEKTIQANTAIGDKANNNESFINTDSTITISVDEQTIEDRVLSTATSYYKNENMSVFIDKELGIYLRPIYTPVEMTISFRLRFKDRTQAQRYRNNLKTRVSMGRAAVVHQVTYHYPLPKEFVYMLVKMHEMREAVEPLNESLKDWFDRCMDERITTITNQAGNVDKGMLVFPENQIGLMGWFDFSYQPDKEEKENDAGSYVCGFDYKIQYDKVTDVLLEYPLMIHNQILPKTLRDDPIPQGFDVISQTSQLSRYLFDFMTSLNPVEGEGIDGVCIPQFDEWLTPKINIGTATLITVLLEVNPEDKREIFKLTDLPDYEFRENFIEFLTEEAPFIGLYGKSIFHFRLFEGNNPTGNDKVTMDDELNIRSVNELNIRKVNRLHIGIVTDLACLDEAAIDRLRKKPDILEAYVKMICGGITIPEPLANGWISKKAIAEVAADLRKCQNRFEFLKRRMLTVGHYAILTARHRNA